MTRPAAPRLQAVAAGLNQGDPSGNCAATQSLGSPRSGRGHRYAGSPLEASPAGSTPVRSTITVPLDPARGVSYTVVILG
jgi:hypothetical protein